MKIGDKGISLIKKFEGCVLKAYKCPGGIWTIGYGHTLYAEEGNIISTRLAEHLLRLDVEHAENVVRHSVRVKINSNQFDALVSFVFNIGIGAFKGSTLLKLLNSGDEAGAADEFLRWVFAQKKELDGLVARRKAERELFLEPIQ